MARVGPQRHRKKNHNVRCNAAIHKDMHIHNSVVEEREYLLSSQIGDCDNSFLVRMDIM